VEDFEETLLDVCCNAGRTYVQGSQIIAAASKILPSGEAFKWRFKRASFYKLTHKRIAIDHHATAFDADRHIAFLQFRSDEQEKTMFLKEHTTNAPHQTLAGPFVQPAGDVSDSIASWTYSGADACWPILDVIVQGSKLQHESRFPDCGRIVLTGLSQCDIPVCVPSHWRQGTLMVEIFRVINRGPSVQTMNQFSVMVDGVKVTSGAFSMAIEANNQSSPSQT
jgi:hypothetical protein